MSIEIRAAKQRYQEHARNALKAALGPVQEFAGRPIQLQPFTRRVEQAYLEQWCAARENVSFQWEDIWARFKELDALHLVVWCEGRLSALALFTAGGKHLRIRFLEGDARPDCPLKGKRAVIVAEVAASYAQAIGKTELRIEPINEATRALYIDGLGFQPVIDHKGRETYFQRPV